MNTPALLIVIATTFYVLFQIGAWLTLATAMSGKFTKFSVSLNAPFLASLFGLVLAHLANTYL